MLQLTEFIWQPPEPQKHTKNKPQQYSQNKRQKTHYKTMIQVLIPWVVTKNNCD